MPPAADPAAPDHKPERPLIGRLRGAYADEGFLAALLIFDIATVALFIALTFVPPAPWVVVVDRIVGLLILAELLARLVAAQNRSALLQRPSTLLDFAIVASLLIPISGSFAFLRVVRALRLVRALPVLRTALRRNPWLARRGDVAAGLGNLLVFVFVTSAVVYEFQVDINPKIESFSDALYFTVTTLTTTGFGDIVLVGETGRWLSIIIMITGISLFVRLAQAVFRPERVQHPCPGCGLGRHDSDAVHCKHCGTLLRLPHAE